MGLDHLLSNRIIHRDLKPQNILVTNTLDVQIADYGLSRSIEFDNRPYTTNVVSLWYRAPELLLGFSEYTPAIDIWSIGCIFYELILKHPPFQGKTEVEQITEIFRNLGSPIIDEFLGQTNLAKSDPSKYNETTIYDKLPKDFHSSYGLDLMKSMFEYDHTKRITAREALHHEYFWSDD